MEQGIREYDDRVEIMIPLNPYTKKNSQQICYRWAKGKRVPFISPSANYRKYQNQCGFFLQRMNLDYPMNIEAKFYMETRRKVDLTNLLESLHDILVFYDVVSDDNAGILVSTDGSRVFYDKENPRTEVIITKTRKTFPKEE